MAAFARTELDMLGMARQDNQAAIQLFVIRDGKMIGRDVFLLDAAREATDDEVLTQLPRAVLRPRDLDPARGLRAGRRSPRRADLEAFLAERRGGPVHLRVPQRGEKRELLALATRNADRDARPRAGPLAGRPGQDAGRARGARRGARAARAAAAHRVLRHQQLPGQRVGRQHGRLRGRQAALAASTGASGSRPCQGPNDFASHQEVLRRRFRSRPDRRGGRRGGAPLGDAGPRHRRWRQGPGQRREGGPRRARPARPAAGRPGEGARGAVPPGRTEPILLPRDVAGALSRPAAARRGAPLRDHLPPRPARASGPSARRSTTCPGVGPKRKRELLKVFGSIKRVRDAPVEQIAAVPGIGPSLAARIKATLEA